MNYRPRGNDRLPFANTQSPWVFRLVALNLIVFVLQSFLMRSEMGRVMEYLFILRPQLVFRGYIWQLFTYMFFHANISHLFWNMFMLWMFGRHVESALGGNGFIRLYLVSGLVAGVCSLVTINSAILGASGAVLGILAAVAVLFPENVVLLFFVLPIKMKYLVWLAAAADILGAVRGTGNIAHIAHIGGLFAGFIYMKTGWYKRPILDLERRRRQRNLDRQRNMNQRVNEILDKVNEKGIDSLTRQEREYLEQARKNR
jgi:membrane associated rhomboid family serine protease